MKPLFVLALAAATLLSPPAWAADAELQVSRAGTRAVAAAPARVPAR